MRCSRGSVERGTLATGRYPEASPGNRRVSRAAPGLGERVERVPHGKSIRTMSELSRKRSKTICLPSGVTSNVRMTRHPRCRRCGSFGCASHAAGRGRQRSRRFTAQSGRVEQRVRLPHIVRPRALPRARRVLCLDGRAGPAGAHGARPCDAAFGAGRPRRTAAAVEPARPGPVHRAAQARLQRHPHRLGWRLRRISAARAGPARPVQDRAEIIRGAGLYRGRGLARLSGRAGVAELADIARLAGRLGAEGFVQGPREARADEAGGAVRGRERPEAYRV